MEIKDRQSGAMKLTKIEAAQEPCPVVVLDVLAHRHHLTPGSACGMATGSCLKRERKSVVATVDIRAVGG
ncbi:hypothetical protein [Nonomuraea lactucae]|uniref:hypothetical protein n=1 Tax=Nonomuraea lactucae TaxID=2249762 RepID=UPI0013B3FD3F|nr:hypothetical protein [Nonomuraea lactucae]